MTGLRTTPINPSGRAQPPASATFTGFVTALISTLLVTLAGTLPWGLPEGYTFVAPMIALASVFYWSWIDRRWMPVWLAFTLGLLIDLLSQGPFGFWSLLSVLSHVGAALIVSRTGLRGWIASWLSFAAVTTLIVAIGWMVASMYFFQAHEWRPIVMSGVVAVVIYPALTLVLSWLARALTPPSRRFKSVGVR